MNHEEPKEETFILQKILQDMRDKDKKIADLEARVKNVIIKYFFKIIDIKS